MGNQSFTFQVSTQLTHSATVYKPSGKMIFQTGNYFKLQDVHKALNEWAKKNKYELNEITK